MCFVFCFFQTADAAQAEKNRQESRQESNFLSILENLDREFGRRESINQKQQDLTHSRDFLMVCFWFGNFEKFFLLLILERVQ